MFNRNKKRIEALETAVRIQSETIAIIAECLASTVGVDMDQIFKNLIEKKANNEGELKENE